MTKTKMYRYLGRNGIITSPILLETIEPIAMLNLRASTGKSLTNGDKITKSVTIFVDELDEWFEIDDPNLEQE
jgi:hypothetical protein